MSGSLAGRLLVAAPSLVDPSFARSVVLLTQHDDRGAMGLVIDRPLDVTVAEAVPGLAALVADDEPVWSGGPVQREAVMALARFDDPSASAEMVLGDVGFLRADLPGDELGRGAREVRVFSGYSGWGPGQLEAELAEEAWIVAPALPEDAFQPAGADVRGAALRRLGGKVALLALLPEDPSVN